MGGISSHATPVDSSSQVMDTSISHSGATDGLIVGSGVGVGGIVTIFSVGAGVGAAGHGKLSGTTGQTQSHVAHVPPHPAKQHLGTPPESRSVQTLKGFAGGAPFPLPFPAFENQD
jgi:hypothetical protein